LRGRGGQDAGMSKESPMARSDARDKAKEVKRTVERIYQSLLRAHRRIFRCAMRSQNDIGSGRPSEQDEKATSLARETYTTTYRDLVVLGFWSDALGGPKFVCSEGGVNIIRAVRAVADGVLRVGNSWRAK